MNANREGGADASDAAAGSSGRRARGLWLGANSTAKTDGGGPPQGTAAPPSNPRRKITFARLATCVLNVERTRRKTVGFYPEL